MAKLWSWSVGEKGVNKVRVYERSVSPSLYVEWTWKGRRHQKVLKRRTDGHPVTDKDLAKDIAKEMSENLRRDHNLAAKVAVFGEEGERNLGRLFEAYHKSRGKRWSAHHAKAMRRFRDFWLRELGSATPLEAVNAAMVESLAEGRGAGPETTRKYLVYITGAFRFARRKLGWITEAHDLTAVDLPKASGTNEAYTAAEVRKVLPALEAVSDEAGWFGHVLFQSGRRPITVRNVKKADVESMDDHSLIRVWDGKAKKWGTVAVVGRAHELTHRLLKRPGEYMLGKEVPDETAMLREWLRVAEQAAGVPHVKGRGWYGFKRRYVGEARGIVGFDKQAGVHPHTLVKHYPPDDMERKLAVAKALAEIAGRSESVSDPDSEARG